MQKKLTHFSISLSHSNIFVQNVFVNEINNNSISLTKSNIFTKDEFASAVHHQPVPNFAQLDNRENKSENDLLLEELD